MSTRAKIDLRADIMRRLYATDHDLRNYIQDQLIYRDELILQLDHAVAALKALGVT